MGIQINGQTDTISASDGGLAVSGYELTGASNINVTGIVTATTFNGDVKVATGSTISGGTNYITASTNGSERVRIDSSGNFGIGETLPDEPLHITASDPAIKLQDSDGTDQYSIIKNAAGDSIYDAVNGTGVGGDHIFRAPTGSSNEHLRITSSGDVGIGEASPNGRLHVADSGNAIVRIQTTDDNQAILNFNGSGASTLGQILYNVPSNYMRFFVNSAERARITSLGEVYVNQTSQDAAVGGNCKLQVRCTQPEHTAAFRNTNSTPYGPIIVYDTDKNNTGSQFLRCNGASTIRAEIRSNGGLANYQSNNANLCDEREKKNIEALDSTWGCLKNWDLKKFHYNEDADTDDKRYGVIAQQVAPHCPEVITDWVKQKSADAVLDDDGNIVTPAVEEVTRMAVREQQMMWMAIKALQEAQTRIETLEAEVAILKAQ